MSILASLPLPVLQAGALVAIGMMAVGGFGLIITLIKEITRD